MPVGRMIWLGLVLVVVVAIGVWWSDSMTRQAQLEASARRVAGHADPLQALDREGPALQSQTGARPVEVLGDPPSLEKRDTDWVIEITQVVRSDGASTVGADVTLEAPPPGATSFHNLRLRRYTWEGEALALRLRLADPPGASERDPRWHLPSYLPRSGRVCISLWQEGCATWFSSVLTCPASRHSRIKVRLEPTREFGGTVLAQEAGAPLASGASVQLTVLGVPAQVFSIDTEVDADGHFVFEPEDVPSGRLLVSASCGEPAVDGWASAERVGSQDRDVQITLGTSHVFSLFVSMLEPARAERFGLRRVTFSALDQTGGDEGHRRHRYLVGSESEEASRPWKRDPFQLVLPVGPDERWRADVPGYRSVEFVLRPSGVERKHDVRLGLKPAADSGLAIFNLAYRGKRRVGVVRADIKALRGEPLTHLWWELPEWPNARHLRAAVRLPSGREFCVRIDADVRRRKGTAPFRVMPHVLTLAARQVYEHEGRIQRCGRVIVMAKRLPAGLAWGALVVRFSHGGYVEDKISWDGGKDKEGRHFVRVSSVVAAGPCHVQLLLRGRPVLWSQVVDVLPGKKHYLRLPDLEVLK